LSLQSIVVPASQDAQVARDYLSDSLASPQSIAPFPRVCAELAQVTAQQAIDAAQLARLIQSDPALAGEIMRVANSPALRPRAGVVSLQQAVSWLGVAEVRNIDDKIETREIVQRAKEVLMKERGLDEPAAFEVIQQSAMRGRTRMRDIAQQILKGEFVG